MVVEEVDPRGAGDLRKPDHRHVVDHRRQERSVSGTVLP
jgi:hypothetical protein